MEAKEVLVTVALKLYMIMEYQVDLAMEEAGVEKEMPQAVVQLVEIDEFQFLINSRLKDSF
jgi:hypothetical protein